MRMNLGSLNHDSEEPDFLLTEIFVFSKVESLNGSGWDGYLLYLTVKTGFDQCQ